MSAIMLRAAKAEVLRYVPRPLVVLLLGPPGSGKGTHASSLSEDFDLPHISTGDLFRKHIQQQTELGQLAKKYLNSGRLVPDELVSDMVFERLSMPDCYRGSILDGFPRNLNQAKSLHERLPQTSHVIALNFNVPETVLIERIAGRLICKSCNRPYHQEFAPPSEFGVCDQCGGDLHTRIDDQEAVFRNRMKNYRQETSPMVDFYARHTGILEEIDGQKPKEQVYRDVLGAVQSS